MDGNIPLTDPATEISLETDVCVSGFLHKNHHIIYAKMLCNLLFDIYLPSPLRVEHDGADVSGYTHQAIACVLQTPPLAH